MLPPIEYKFPLGVAQAERVARMTAREFPGDAFEVVVEPLGTPTTQVIVRVSRESNCAYMKRLTETLSEKT